MTNLSRLAAALAATSIVALSASAAQAVVVVTPPRPTVSIPVVHPNIRPPMPRHIHPTVHPCKCISVPHPPVVSNPYGRPGFASPYIKPPVKQPVPVTTNVVSTSSKPASFGGKPVTANTTVSNWQGPAGHGTETTTVFTDSSGHVVGAISSAASNPSSVTAAAQPTPASSQPAPQPSAAPVHASNPAPATTAPATTPAANQPAAPQSGTTPAHASNPAPAPAAAPAHPSAPASTPAAPPPKKITFTPVEYPAFTDQYGKTVGYYVNGKLVMGFAGPTGGTCVPVMGYQAAGGGGVSQSFSPGSVQVHAVQCYIKS